MGGRNYGVDFVEVFRGGDDNGIVVYNIGVEGWDGSGGVDVLSKDFVDEVRGDFGGGGCGVCGVFGYEGESIVD